LGFYYFILGRIQITNLALQRKDTDIEQASKHLEGLVLWLHSFQIDGFEQCLQKAREKAEDLGIPEDSGFAYRVTRNTRPLRYRTDEINNDLQPPLSNIERFKAEFFDAIMANLL
jgi:hypothetical protein